MAYGPYGYGGYQNPYMNNNYYQQQPVVQQPVQQQNFIPLTFTNGLIGAKAYIMMQPNSVVYLQDSESDKLFIKKSDAQGRCTLETYRLVREQTDENGNVVPTQTMFATKDDLKALQDTLIESINKLSSVVKTAENKEI